MPSVDLTTVRLNDLFVFFKYDVSFTTACMLFHFTLRYCRVLLNLLTKYMFHFVMFFQMLNKWWNLVSISVELNLNNSIFQHHLVVMLDKPQLPNTDVNKMNMLSLLRWDIKTIVVPLQMFSTSESKLSLIIIQRKDFYQPQTFEIKRLKKNFIKFKIIDTEPPFFVTLKCVHFGNTHKSWNNIETKLLWIKIKIFCVINRHKTRTKKSTR